MGVGEEDIVFLTFLSIIIDDFTKCKSERNLTCPLQEVTASYLRCLGIHIESSEDVQSTLELLQM